MTPPAQALLHAYPGVLTAAAAEQWVRERRALLQGRASPTDDFVRAVSSGCAAGGARTHTLDLADDSAHALARLDAGLLPECEVCAATLSFDRLEAAPTAVRCTTCVPRSTFDARWCR